MVGGLWTLKTGQANLSQRFMRARIVAQGATVVCLCMGGVMMGNPAAPGGMPVVAQGRRAT